MSKNDKFGNLFVIEDRGQIQTILSLTFFYYIYRSNQKILLIAVSLNGTQVGHESQLKFPFARNKYNFFEGECIHQRNFLKEQATEEIFKRCNKMSCKILKVRIDQYAVTFGENLALIFFPGLLNVRSTSKSKSFLSFLIAHELNFALDKNSLRTAFGINIKIVRFFMLGPVPIVKFFVGS